MQNTATKIEVTTEQAGTGTYPDTQQEVDVAKSGNNTVTYIKKVYGYCISASNPQTNTTYVIRSNMKTIEEGSCIATVTTFAGTGVSGSADGAGAQAQFAQPAGVVASPDGSVNVSSNNRSPLTVQYQHLPVPEQAERQVDPLRLLNFRNLEK